MVSYKVFKSKRLIIRPTLEEDAELIYQLMNTAKFIKYVDDRQLDSISSAESYIKLKMLPQLKAKGYSNYTLINAINGSKIGICGLYDRIGIEGIEVGFGILPKFEGLGYAYESASRIIKAAFEEFKIEELKAITDQKNIASQNLLKKLGFELNGKIVLPNEDDELFLFRFKKFI
jgi:ribosomal-protein-alanine N-acetyltransferase